MSAFIVSFEPEHWQAPTGSLQLSNILIDQGFKDPVQLQKPGVTIVWCDSLEQKNPSYRYLLKEPAAIFLVGVLVYKDLMGDLALSALLDDFTEPNRLNPFDIAGNFQCVIYKNGKTWIFGDPVGMIKTYKLKDRRVFSTSWLACSDLSKTHTVDRIGTLMYLTLAANYDTSTIFKEVVLADPTVAHTAKESDSICVYPSKIWTNGETYTSFEDAAQDAAELLRKRFKQVKRFYPGTIVNALSGGFDSRLIVAGLKDVGAETLLYVFGKPGDDDVKNAKMVSDGLGLKLEYVDKSVSNRHLPELTKEHVEQSLRFFDGTPADGFFDRGADQQTRTRYGSCGSILLNGGAGEIMRDYMILRDGRFNARNLVSVFYSQYMPAMFVSREDVSALQSSITKHIDKQLDGNGGAYERRMIELAYPLVRARYWLSRNNSVANRVGGFWTIPLDPTLVRKTHRYPMAWKNYGRLEAKVIDLLDHETASYVSGYGFSFANGPPLRYQVNLKLQQHRPPILRQHSASIKRALGLTKPYSLPAEGLALLPGQLQVSRLFNVELVGDYAQADRVMSVEYLIRKYNAKLVD